MKTEQIEIPSLTDAHTHTVAPSGTALQCLCSTSPEDWASVADIQPKHVIPFLGLHPWNIRPEQATADMASLANLLRQTPRAGIGETGLDDAHRPLSPKSLQKEILLAHLELAEQLQRPVTLHCCRAWGTLAGMLALYPELTYIVHGWAGDASLLPAFLPLHTYFSIGPHHLPNEQTLRRIPRERLLIESDSNHKALPLIYQSVADSLALSVQECNALVHDNLGAALGRIIPQAQL